MLLLANLDLGQTALKPKDIPVEMKSKMFSLWNEIQEDESLYWFCKYWSLRYETAQRLPESAHYARKAVEYKAKKEIAMKELEGLVKQVCPSEGTLGAVISQTKTGEIQCGWWCVDSETRREIAEIVTLVVRREMRLLQKEIAGACVEILSQFSGDIAEAIAQGNVEHFKKLAQNVYGPRANIYEVRSTDETLRRAAEESARKRRESELEVTIEDF
jgi:hypothetical protein